MSLEDLARLINSTDEWEVEFPEIIEVNGLEGLSGDAWDICADGKKPLDVF